MKKIYTLFALLTALCSMVAHAAYTEGDTRMVTIHVIDPDHTTLTNYNNYAKLVLDESGSVEVTFGEIVSGDPLKYIEVETSDGYVVKSITNSAGKEISTSKLPSDYTKIEGIGYDDNYVLDFNVEDGDVITVEVDEPTNKIFTINANPAHIKSITYGSSSDYYEVEPKEEGVWEIDGTSNQKIAISVNDGCKITNIVDAEGKEVRNTSNVTLANIWCDEFKEGTTFTVNSYREEDARTATLTVKIEDGDASDVTFYRAGKTLTLDGIESVVKFDPETESEFKVIRNPWSKKFYKVLLGEEEIEADKNGYHVFTPQSGDVLTIKVGYPDVDVPVKFEGTTEALINVSCNGTTYSAEECLADGFTLKLGSTFYVSCDEAQYDVTGTLFNGVDGYKGEILTEDEFVVTIVATKIQMTEVTVKCDAWEHISLEDDWYKAIELTGAETELSLNPSLEYMIISTKDGYVLNSVTDEATGKDLLEVGYYNTKIVGFESGMTIVIDASKFVRDKEMVVYLEEDIEWKDQRFFLSYYSDLEERITLAEGYTTIAFGNGDFSDSTFAVEPADDADVVVYLNDEKMEMESSYYGPYPVGMDKIQDGDVMKIFSEEKTPHTVTYQIPEGVNAEIVHDHVKTIDSPSTHDVLPGTEIHIKPVAAKTRDAAASSLIVTVNDEVQAPGADGIYTVKVDSPKTIKVENDPSTSISEISAAGTSTKAFDLQGRRVSANHRGLIIENGTLKVRK